LNPLAIGSVGERDEESLGARETHSQVFESSARTFGRCG
jgi:hypothetical protein